MKIANRVLLVCLFITIAFIFFAQPSPVAAQEACAIPESGPWPPCATGAAASVAAENCVIPASGPWPACAKSGNATVAAAAAGGDCVIPQSGPWPPCAANGASPPPAQTPVAADTQLVVSQPIQWRSTTMRQNDIVYARFSVRNASGRPLFLRSLGVAVRGPHCAGQNFGCADVQDFPFAKNITIPAHGSVTVEKRQQLPEAGRYHAFVVAVDGSGTIKPLTHGQTFSIEPSDSKRRGNSWRFGVNIHPYWNQDDQKLVAAAHSVGADMLRISLRWPLLQPNSRASWEDGPHWRFDHLTGIIDEASRRGMSVMISLTQTPCWASSDPARYCAGGRYDPRYPPANPADYARALQELVRRYGTRISAYEVWNEPNDRKHWINPDAARYTTLLKNAYTAAKSINPNVTILGGALAGTLYDVPAEAEFLDLMYANGAAQYYDALSIHPYSLQAPDDCSRFLYGSYRCGVEGVRALMLHNNDHKPLWLTEVSWSSGVWGEHNQLNHLRTALRLIDSWDYVPVVSWFSLCDSGRVSDAALGDAQMGLFTRNCAQPKQAARWLQGNGRRLPASLYP